MELQANGFLVVNKPQGMTSHDVVDRVRRLFPKRKVGHGGTLDPLATGVLVLGIGQATKQLQTFLNDDKRYVADFQLGIETDTQDSTGAVIREINPVVVSEDEFTQACLNFRGAILQTPPMYSAKKVNGKRLYRLARQGVEVEREPKEVIVHALDVIAFDGVCGRLSVHCSKGTYVRTLCHDLGQSLGVGAHMTGLVRTQSGDFVLENAWTLEQLEQMTFEERFRSLADQDKMRDTSLTS